jgi:hypothetical protein
MTLYVQSIGRLLVDVKPSTKLESSFFVMEATPVSSFAAKENLKSRHEVVFNELLAAPRPLSMNLVVMILR